GAEFLDLIRCRLDVEVHVLLRRAEVAFEAMARLHSEFGVPEFYATELLEGMAMDVRRVAYRDESELLIYCYRVASTVGLMMTHVMGVSQQRALAHAGSLGIAMQLTNIARDVGEDARAGRLYLPADWMEQAGLDPQAWLSAPCFHPELARVIKRLLAHADTLYRQSESATPYLPWRCRPAILAASRVYAEIGRALESASFDAVNRRAVVGATRKWQLIALSLLRSATPAKPAALSAAGELSSLAEAIRPVIESLIRSGHADWQLTRPQGTSGLARLASVFERLEALDREQRALQHPGFDRESGRLISG
ncbi:MAG: phytoene/squalene synthase family protein, partial [Betaproteobacteria bacterium]|nr:phytoene/squalene synthase family protein [Betaproteobacteria bacterium]